MAAPVVTKALRDTSVIIDATGLDAWRGIEPLISSVTLGEVHAGVEQGDAMERAIRRRRRGFFPQGCIRPTGSRTSTTRSRP